MSCHCPRTAEEGLEEILWPHSAMFLMAKLTSYTEQWPYAEKRRNRRREGYRRGRRRQEDEEEGGGEEDNVP